MTKEFNVRKLAEQLYENVISYKEELDKIGARELYLYIKNDSDLYRSTLPIMKKLAKKMEKDNYDSKLAIKTWMYLVDAGVKKYKKEIGTPDDIIFDKKTREETAKLLAQDFED